MFSLLLAVLHLLRGHADNEQCNPRYAQPCGRHAQTLQYTRHKLLFICPVCLPASLPRTRARDWGWGIQFGVFCTPRKTDVCAAVEGEKQHLLDLRVTKFQFIAGARLSAGMQLVSWALSFANERECLRRVKSVFIFATADNFSHNFTVSAWIICKLKEKTIYLGEVPNTI